MELKSFFSPHSVKCSPSLLTSSFPLPPNFLCVQIHEYSLENFRVLGAQGLCCSSQISQPSLCHPWPNSQSCQPSPRKGLELLVFLGLLRSMASPINQKAVKGAPWSSASSFCPKLGDELPTALRDLPGVCQLRLSVGEEILGLLLVCLDRPGPVLQVHVGVLIINPGFWRPPLSDLTKHTRSVCKPWRWNFYSIFIPFLFHFF